MHIFWETIVSNSLVVTVMATALALLGRIWKNPLALHVLWVLLLLKFVTPPLLILPVPLTMNRQLPAPLQKAGREFADRSPVEVSRAGENASVSFGQQQRESRGGQSPASVAPIDVASALADQRLSWMAVLTWSWVVGSALFASAQARRILRLRKRLCAALPATPAVRRMAGEIAGRLGMTRTPEVLMVSFRLSPLVWSPGVRPRLVLPASLFAQLDVAAQEAIVAHELAHIRRGDHWVRLLELPITSLFWWHPVVWWACRMLRELEEQCCDGMVLSAVPDCGRAYATALVDTLDYLSERSMALPPAATGASTLVSLSRRIKMLRNPVRVRSLTVGRLLVLLAVAAVPMAVAFAARTPPPDNRVSSGEEERLNQPVGDERRPDRERNALLAQKGDNEGTSQPAADNPAGTDQKAKEKNTVNHSLETWRMSMSLEGAGLATPAVQWAIFDEDPIPGFEARTKKRQWVYREQLRRAENEAAREDTRSEWMTMQWDSAFKEIPGDRLNLLTSDTHDPIKSSEPDGKKWIATKVVMAKGKPTCWCMPVEVKYGEEIKVTLTDKNVFDLGSVFANALQEAAASSENKNKEKWLGTAWMIQLNLRVPGRAPFEVPFAIFDEDPVPGFKGSVKKAGPLVKEAVGAEELPAAMAAAWALIFRKVTGDRLDQLPSGGSLFCSSNGSDGKKWIVTKVVQIDGKPVCWCIPVEVKTGKEISVTLTRDNVFDLGSVFDSPK